MKTVMSKIKKLEQKHDSIEATKAILLPFWPESKRGTPNSFLRSALFSAVQSKNREDMKEVTLASQAGFTIKYTGQQLNQEDLTLWNALIHLARNSALEDVCEFTAYEILYSMKLGTGATEYAILHTGITRLTACAVEIVRDGDKRGFFGPLIAYGETHVVGSTTKYKLKLNRTLIRLYRDDTCWLDFGQRLQLRRKPLAQFLHGYYSTHSRPHPVKADTLRKLSGSKEKSLPAFRQKLKRALDELITIGFLSCWSLDADDLIIVARKNYRD